MVPAGMPPPGVAPRFHDPPSLTPTSIGLCVFLIAWGTSFAAIRVWINRSKLGIGDGEVHACDVEMDTGKLTKSQSS